MSNEIWQDYEWRIMSNVEGGPHGLEQGTIPAFVSTECVAKKVVAGG